MKVTRRNSVFDYDSIAYMRSTKILKDDKITKTCNKCKKNFTKDDAIFSKHATKGRRRFYHLKCWESFHH